MSWRIESKEVISNKQLLVDMRTVSFRCLHLLLLLEVIYIYIYDVLSLLCGVVMEEGPGTNTCPL